MPVRQVSIEAYYDLVVSGKATTQKARIMKLLIDIKRPITRHEITQWFSPYNVAAGHAEGPPIPLQSVTGHVTHLIRDGYARECGTGPDPITGNRANFVEPIREVWEARRTFQGSLFDDQT